MVITIPTVEQVEHFTRFVEPGRGFMATVMSPSAGARGISLMQLQRVEQFLEVRSIEDYQAVSYRMDIHYVDFGALAQWIDEVIGDTELAEQVRDVVRAEEGFGPLVSTVKTLLRERMDQYKAVLGIDEDADGATEPGAPDAQEGSGD